MLSRFRPLAFVLAVLAAFTFVGVADAGWVAFKNNTPKAIVVQEFVFVNGKKVYGKPYKLLPGEAFREFQNNPGIKNYSVIDAANPNNTLWSNPLVCKGNSQSFAVGVVQGKVVVVPVQGLK